MCVCFGSRQEELIKLHEVCTWLNHFKLSHTPPHVQPQSTLRTTHKSSTVVTESGLQVGCLLEVVRKAQAQLGVDGAGPHEVGSDLFSADETFPARK